MNRKEAIKKWEEIIKEVEDNRSELNNILASARQSNDQTTAVLSDIKTKLGEVNLTENQINQKLQITEQYRLNIEQKDKEIDNKLKGISEIYNEVGIKKEEIGKIESEIKNQFDKNNDIRNQIEEELKAGTTSVNLSKSFADKVKEYHLGSKLWSACFIGFVISLVFYFGYVTLQITDIKTTEDVWRHLAFRSPFIIFAVWLAIFFGNRRAESKKLEELYKHKEVMARSFVGYKQTLEKLNGESTDLLKQLMKSLLDAIGDNSAKFLNSEGDKHPLFGMIDYFSKSKKNSTKDE